MADLGNLVRTLRLQCSACEWVPTKDMRVDHARLHFQVEHDTDQVTLEMVPVCTCGAVMEHTESRPTGGGFKDYVKCPACGNTGFVKRDA